jgi:hypothetical protein
VLGIAGLVGTAAVLFLYFKSQTALYRPDERSPEITSTLARALPSNAPQPQLTDVAAAAGLAGYRSFIGERTSQLP